MHAVVYMFVKNTFALKSINYLRNYILNANNFTVDFKFEKKMDMYKQLKKIKT